MENKINWQKTKENIELNLKQYYYYCLSLCTEQNIKQDKDHNLKMINESEVNIRYLNLPKEETEKRMEFINKIRFAYNKLNSFEKKIVYWTYFDQENKYDDGYIANELGFSLGYYYSIKKETLIRLAYALGIEVKTDD